MTFTVPNVEELIPIKNEFMIDLNHLRGKKDITKQRLGTIVINTEVRKVGVLSALEKRDCCKRQ
jgi:hypothetical protein